MSAKHYTISRTNKILFHLIQQIFIALPKSYKACIVIISLSKNKAHKKDWYLTS